MTHSKDAGRRSFGWGPEGLGRVGLKSKQQTNALLGAFATGVGDVNGDGWDDVASVGSYDGGAE
jgi:hypothetical protein